VPYNASIIANERMDVFAIFSIVDAILKLSIALLIPFFSENKLIIFAAMMFGCAFIVKLCYRLYCMKSFKECKIRRNAKRKTIFEILSYSGWNLLGSFSHVAIDQGVNIILNS
jgi:hypothetical protein